MPFQLASVDLGHRGHGPEMRATRAAQDEAAELKAQAAFIETMRVQLEANTSGSTLAVNHPQH